MTLVEIIARSWGWTGIQPAAVVGENDFGNLMVRDVRGMYWRICPEELSCEVVAQDRAALDALSTDQGFLKDWAMRALVEEARKSLGPLEEGRKYGLKIPGVLGGAYGGDNLAQLPLADIIGAAGDIARQIDGLPDGSKVQLRVTE